MILGQKVFVEAHWMPCEPVVYTASLMKMTQNMAVNDEAVIVQSTKYSTQTVQKVKQYAVQKLMYAYTETVKKCYIFVIKHI